MVLYRNIVIRGILWLPILYILYHHSLDFLSKVTMLFTINDRSIIKGYPNEDVTCINDNVDNFVV